MRNARCVGGPQEHFLQHAQQVRIRRGQPRPPLEQTRVLLAQTAAACGSGRRGHGRAAAAAWQFARATLWRRALGGGSDGSAVVPG